MSVFDAVCALLHDRGIPFRSVHHEPTTTSDASAAARGESVRIGGKAIVMKIDDGFKLFVLSADLRIDSKKIKERFKAKSLRFATPEELKALTGLVPGSVPPFGEPVLPLEIYHDLSLSENDAIAFNAGTLTDSIVMKSSDYRSLVTAEQFDFALRPLQSTTLNKGIP